jgi:hypothetical protein
MKQGKGDLNFDGEGDADNGVGEGHDLPGRKRAELSMAQERCIKLHGKERELPSEG